jgi:(p)ppGpp synthase/HD superfamily hydrolase
MVVDNAKMFAIAAHGAVNQRRKYSGEHYYVHPARVALLVAEVGQDQEVIAAAWLHDVLEDTSVSDDLMYTFFPKRVVDLVKEVTFFKRATLNRSGNHKLKLRKLMEISSTGQILKLCDIIANLENFESLVGRTSLKYANEYLREKKEEIDVLDKAPAKLIIKAMAQTLKANMLITEKEKK